MLFYAPAALRRWRRILTPLLVSIIVLAVGAIVVMPPEPVMHVLAAVGLGLVACALLLLLLNGEPLPQADVFATAKLDPETTVEFASTVSPASASKAYGEFWLRSLRELRFGTFLMPPVALALVAVGIAKTGEGTTASFFALFAVMSILSSFASYLKGKRISTMQARALPVRKIRVSREGIAIGDAEGGLAWSSVVRVWDFPEHVTLVLHPLVGIQIPKADIPPAARYLIAVSTPPPS
jgi:hypothetical protein